MARPSAALVTALRQTALRLERVATVYRWSHFAHCNCGHLAQTITGLAPTDIYEAARVREGDWGQQAAVSPLRLDRPDYGDRPALDEGAWEPEDRGVCTVTGSPIDLVLEQMFGLGLDREDIRHLERLSDPSVRRRLGSSTTEFAHGDRANVVAYLRAWADLLEEALPARLATPAAEQAEDLPLAAE